jgi:hypothetical protein
MVSTSWSQVDLGEPLGPKRFGYRWAQVETIWALWVVDGAAVTSFSAAVAASSAAAGSESVLRSGSAADSRSTASRTRTPLPTRVRMLTRERARVWAFMLLIWTRWLLLLIYLLPSLLASSLSLVRLS